MPILGTLMTGLMRLLFWVFGRYMVAEKAFNLAMTLIVVGLAVVLVNGINSCATGVCALAIAGLSDTNPNFGVGLGLAFNSVTYTAAACYMTIWIGCQLYVIKKSVIKMMK